MDLKNAVNIKSKSKNVYLKMLNFYDKNKLWDPDIFKSHFI
jgi:hypothetical protein